MPISIQCPNHHKLSVSETHAGKRIQCPKCKAIVQVPAAAANQAERSQPNQPDAGKAGSRQGSAASAPSTDDGMPGFMDAELPTSQPHVGLPAFNFEEAVPSAAAHPSAKNRNSVAPARATVQSTQRVQTPSTLVASRTSGPWADFAKGFVIALASVLLGGGLLWYALREPEAAMGGAAITQAIRANPGTPVIVIEKTTVTQGTPYVGGGPVNADGTPASLPYRTDTQNAIAGTEPAAISKPSQQEQSKPNAGLQSMQLGSGAMAFPLNTHSWSSAYDAETGILAVTDDQLGIRFLDLDKLNQGSLLERTSIAVTGRPCSVCLKKFENRKWFACAASDSSEIKLIDASTLEPADSIQIPQSDFVRQVSASDNPSDPFLYFVVSRTSANTTRGFAGRVDMRSREVQLFTEHPIGTLAISEDGNLLAANGEMARGETDKHFIGSWETLLSHSKGPPPLEEIANGANSGARMLRNQAAIGTAILQNQFDADGERGYSVERYCKFEPIAAFPSRPSLLGVSKNAIVLASSTNLEILAKVPLPPEMTDRERLYKEKPHQDDPRFQSFASSYVGGTSLNAFVDDRRNLAIVAFDNYLVILPIQALDLPDSNPLDFQLSLPNSVFVGEPLEIQVPVQAVQQGLAMEIKRSDPSLQKPRNDQKSFPPALAATMNANQNIVYVQNSEAFLGHALPFKIKVGTEVMTVFEFKPSMRELRVLRTAEMQHRVTEEVVIMSARQTDLPRYDDGKIRWTPSADARGPSNLVLQGRLGKRTRDWTWPIEVKMPMEQIPFPFYVRGSTGLVDSNSLVVWGLTPQDAKIRIGNSLQSENRRDNGFLCIYDLDKKAIAQQVSLPYEIEVAALHETGVYAVSLNSTAQMRGKESSPGRLLRFDPKSLELLDAVPIPSRSNSFGRSYRLFVQGKDRLSVVSEREKVNLEQMGSLRDTYDYRFRLPGLELDRDAVAPYCPIDGRLLGGPIVDGTLWDESLQTPRLMIAPDLFTKSNWPQIVSIGSELWNRQLEGAHSCMLSTSELPWLPGMHLPESNITIASEPGALYILSNNPLRPVDSLPVVDMIPIPKPEKPIREPDEFDDEPFLNDRYEWIEKSESVSSAGTQVFAANEGRLFAVPRNCIAAASPTFSFIDQQSTFVLQADESTTVRYEAPGAIKYHLRVYLESPNEKRSLNFKEASYPPALVDLESTDGEFEVRLEGEAVTDAILRDWKRRFRSLENLNPDAITSRIKEISVPYKNLTGNAPKTIPAVALAVVTAEHANGIQRTGLVNYFLVEIPIQKLLREASQAK